MRPSKVVPTSPARVADFQDLSKPAKERIAIAVNRFFTAFGIGVPLFEIAQLAETNAATVRRHYGSHEGLVQIYIDKLFKEEEGYWLERENEHRGQPEAQLRAWIRGIELESQDAFSASCQLARAAAHLYRFNGSDLLGQMRSARIRERDRIALLCKKAGFDDPSTLADKLVLLLDGARSDSNCFGYRGPYAQLCEAAGDLMATHRGGMKPAIPRDE